MALFRNFGVNHAKDVTGLRNRLCGIQKYASAAIPAIFLNLRKIAHFWIGNLSVLFMKPRMGTNWALWRAHLQLRSDQRGQINHAARVARFVIVPGQNFYHVVDNMSRGGIDDR